MASYNSDDALNTGKNEVKIDEMVSIELEPLDKDKSAEELQTKDKKTKKIKKKSKDGKDDEEKEEIKTVPYLKLYRFATNWDLFLIFVGVISAAAHGAAQPVFTIFFGEIIDSFGGSQADLVASVQKNCLYFVYLGLAVLVTSYLQVACFITAASNQSHRMRFAYFDSLLRQDQSWYDTINSGELTARVATDVAKVEQGLADKVGSFVQYMAMCIGGIIVGFVKGWQLTLVIFAVSPLLVIGGAVMGMLLGNATADGQKAYSKADGVANEVFSLFRTVVAFSGEEEETKRYEKELETAYSFGVRKSLISGVGMGFTMGIIVLVYALGFWVGYEFIKKGWQTPGEVLTTFFACIIGAMAVGQAAPNITAMATAQGSAHFIFEVIDRQSEIDQLSGEGIVPESGDENVKGEIKFDKVLFEYKKDTPVLKNMNFELNAGETLALIGQSGCGKSTTVQLLERFYNATEGVCTMDGIDISKLNIQWFRSQVGIVSQMPTLFAGTIGENIALGIGYHLNPKFDQSHPESLFNRRFIQKEVTDEMIHEAAKKANAYNFIMKMPAGFDTVIGARGAQLSGGQKQRIAIARALVRNPKVLLLDEATSALDSESERVVQAALEKASEGRTCIVIAHRLSTIVNATKIAVVSDGHIIEIGNHQELMGIENGNYRRMKEMQDLHLEEETEDMNADLQYASDRKQSDRKVSTRSEIRKASSRSKKGDYEEQEDSQDDESDSLSLDADGKKKKKKKKEDDPGMSVVKRAFKMNSPEWAWILMGCFGCVLNGMLWPVFSLVFSSMLGAYLSNDQDEVNKWTLIFVGLAVGAAVGNLLSMYAIGVAGERLTRRMRLESFKKLVRQPIYWFDNSDNSVGVLTTRLSSDATLVRGLTGDSFSIFITQIVTLITGLVIAFTACPKLAAVVLACLPVLGGASMVQMKLMSGFMEDGAKVYEEAGKIASEAVDNITTVNALNSGYFFLKKYSDQLEKPKKANFMKAQVAAVIFGFAEFSMFAIWALAFWYGGELVNSGECSFDDMMKAISAIIFGAMTLGQISAMAPDAAAGRVAAGKVFGYLDLKSDIDIEDENGEKPDTITGDVSFNEIAFVYPTRPDVNVLKSASCQINNGATMALVGESGCGKSTLISLMEQFYKPAGGYIAIDNKPITDYNLKYIRSQIGIVSQEPDLFNKTVRENIAYGFGKTEGVVVTDEQIEWAAKKANAHDFIMKLPEGYDSPVGERGGLLSGGQKQRVAIARALVRDPKILLLDEATSALDSESERVVQKALDAATEGRTTIVIAHRLASIANSDKICVIGQGQVMESGTHSDLISKKGPYYNLVVAQSGTNN